MSRDPLEVEQVRERYAQACLELQALAYRDVRSAWKHLPDDAVERAAMLDDLIRGVEATHGAAAHAVSVEFITSKRALEGVASDAPIVEPDLLSEEAVTRMRDKVLLYLDESREDLALKALLRSCGNTVMNRARNTVRASAEEAGFRWCRVPEPGACAFCLMLASRGDVYRSEQVALYKKGTKERYHAHCRCVVEEVLPGGELPEATRRVVELSRQVGDSVGEWEDAKRDPQFMRYMWETYIRDDPTREARLGPSRLPAGFRPVYPRPAEDRDLPGITLEDIEVAFFGKTKVTPDGQIKHQGGHGYAIGNPGKSEIPPSWDTDDFIDAAFQTVLDPQWFDIKGDRRECLREYHGVIMRVSYYPSPEGTLIISHIYPENGHDVFKNPSEMGVDGMVPFDIHVLEREPERLGGI